jgi:hypothetical protein
MMEDRRFYMVKKYLAFNILGIFVMIPNRLCFYNSAKFGVQGCPE